jgi:hypothetical protein
MRLQTFPDTPDQNDHLLLYGRHYGVVVADFGHEL